LALAPPPRQARARPNIVADTFSAILQRYLVYFQPPLGKVRSGIEYESPLGNKGFWVTTFTDPKFSIAELISSKPLGVSQNLRTNVKIVRSLNTLIGAPPHFGLFDIRLSRFESLRPADAMIFFAVASGFAEGSQNRFHN
jgi:hypothetical protein